MFNPYDPNNRSNQMPVNFIPPSPYNPFNPLNQYGFNQNNNSGPKNNLFRELWQDKNVRNEFKNQMVGLANKYSENYNQRSDNNFNARHPGSHYDVFDKMNDNITKGLYFSDEHLGTGCVGHGIATAGRITRNNYEIFYDRSPYTNNYDRAMDAYDKATNIGFI